MKAENVDEFFAMVEDNDVDFTGSNEHADVPVLTYRWCRNNAIAGVAVPMVVAVGEECMQAMGLKRVVCKGRHLRGDTDTGQRVKMTVMQAGGQSMYLIMTAGLPGTREKAKEINTQLAQQIEKRLASRGSA